MRGRWIRREGVRTRVDEDPSLTPGPSDRVQAWLRVVKAPSRLAPSSHLRLAGPDPFGAFNGGSKRCYGSPAIALCIRSRRYGRRVERSIGAAFALESTNHRSRFRQALLAVSRRRVGRCNGAFAVHVYRRNANELALVQGSLVGAEGRERSVRMRPRRCRDRAAVAGCVAGLHRE